LETFRYLPDVTTLKVDTEACIGSGACVQVCPHRVFTLEEKKARVGDRDGCMECGACAVNCPVHAIGLTPGVGCAAYIIQTWLRGKEAASCGDACC
jgi:NAD-dependent dihydropyrimidine dehydrogenase PreA subunit